MEKSARPVPDLSLSSDGALGRACDSKRLKCVRLAAN